MSLPEPRKPFPVKYPYLVRSDLYKSDKAAFGYDEDSLFLVDSDFEEVAWTSLDILKQYPDHARAYLDDDLDNLSNCLWDVAASIALDMPDYANFENMRFTSKLNGLSLKRGEPIQFESEKAIFPELGEACYEHLKDLNPFEQLCDVLRLSVEEDLVIGKVAPDLSSDLMECLLVPIPSKWDPLEKLGLSFAKVHAPIPNSERLQSAASHLVNAIMTKGDYVRYNWTLGTERLERNPAIETWSSEEQQIAGSIEDIQSLLQKVYFRSERQTFKAFPQHNRYLFVIHTYIHPLAEILTTRERQEKFLDTLCSMPEDVRKHRGMVSAVISHLSLALQK